MRVIFLFSLFILFSNCNKPKTVLICGDHICVNKKEAEQFFNENLSIEVKIIDKKIKRDINLVELNLKQNIKGKKEISVSNKKKTNQKLKTLSKDEINKIKESIKNKKGKKKIAKKIKEKKNNDPIKKKKEEDKK